MPFLSDQSSQDRATSSSTNRRPEIASRKSRTGTQMTTEVIIQVAILIFALAISYAIRYLSRQTLPQVRTKTRTTVQASRHLAQATRLLGRAKSTQDKPKTQSIAKHALTEAQMAVSIDPRHPQPHIVKARILEFMGHESSALKSLDLALNLPRVKSLSVNERSELLVKRAELKLSKNRPRRLDSAVEDLKEAVRLSHAHGEDNSKATAFRLLSRCNELLGLTEEAKTRALESSGS